MTVKITVSLPDELVGAARQAVQDGQAASVSAYIAESLQRRERAKGLANLLAEWDQELGPPVAEDYAWANEQLGSA